MDSQKRKQKKSVKNMWPTDRIFKLKDLGLKKNCYILGTQYCFTCIVYDILICMYFSIEKGE